MSSAGVVIVVTGAGVISNPPSRSNRSWLLVDTGALLVVVIVSEGLIISRSEPSVPPNRSRRAFWEINRKIIRYTCERLEKNLEEKKNNSFYISETEEN